MIPDLPALADESALEAPFAAPVAVIYKHSPLCGLSSIAAGEVARFRERSPETPVYLVDVIRSRAVSRAVESRVGVRHESPQVLVLRDGEVVWDASHRGVQAEALERQVREASAP